MSATTEKELTAFIALIYQINRMIVSLTQFSQKLVTENRALKVKVGVLESEKEISKSEECKHDLYLKDNTLKSYPMSEDHIVDACTVCARPIQLITRD